MSKLTIEEVCPVIARGGSAENTSGNFWGSGTAPSKYWTADRGWMPQNYTYGARGVRGKSRPLGRELDKAAEILGGYQGIVYSFATPVALKMGGVWIVPNVSYSTRTGRHMGNLYQLGETRRVPHDASAQEIVDVVRGYIALDPWKKTYHRGPVSRIMHRVRMNGRAVSQFSDENAAHRMADSLAENYPDRRVTVRSEELAA